MEVAVGSTDRDRRTKRLAYTKFQSQFQEQSGWKSLVEARCCVHRLVWDQASAIFLLEGECSVLHVQRGTLTSTIGAWVLVRVAAEAT